MSASNQKEYLREWKKRNPDYFREYQQRWSLLNKEKRRVYLKEYMKKYREKNQFKIDARKKVYIEIRAGRLERGPCTICGDPKSEAHHPNYSKPLDIIWLCKKHHELADLT